MKKLILSCTLCLLAAGASAQQWTTRTYTVHDGLPGNTLNGILRDRRGFIWIGTENGVVRFDGSRFRQYRVSEGLPDNEIMDLQTGSSHEIWALPYRNHPAVYNPLTDRFERSTSDSMLRKHRRPSVCFKTTCFTVDSAGIRKNMQDASGKKFRTLTSRIPFPASNLSFTGRHLALISDNGTAAALIDTGNLSVVFHLPLDGALAGQILEDEEGHIWIATLGQGLIKLSRHPVTAYNHLLPPDMSPVAVAIDGAVFLCGDNKGRIAIFRSGCVEKIINISKWSRAISRIRNILVLKDGYYIAVEGDASLLLDRHYNVVSLFNRPHLNFSDRCAALWQDSIILAGSQNLAVRLNYKACRGYDSVFIRTTAIGADNAGRMLIGAADGLYRKDDTGLYAFAGAMPSFPKRVSDICLTPDGLIWVSLTSGFIAAIKGDQVAGIISTGPQIPGNVCHAICAGKKGQLWLGTDKALSRISYTFSKGRLRWKASSFGPADGLYGQITDIACQQDSVYVATTSGLYTLPGHISPSVRDIPVYITGIRINDRDTVLKDSWELPYSMNDLEIRFAGIDPAGYMPVYQYRINGDSWQDAGDAHLMLKRLSPGDYRIDIRALKRDGEASVHIASLKVHLNTPFWMSSWFWLALFFILFGSAAYVLQRNFRRKKEKQLLSIKTEHELITSRQQTFSALMNPHFIFNALNSIQHYVLVHDKRAANRYLSGFGRLIRMNFESAQKSYISLDEELERLQLYLSLEQMRFGDKLNYSIEVDDEIVPEDWQIPAMIIQPYLENAILHGITPAKGNGRLDIRIQKHGEDLCIIICDNGIGIGNSMQLKQHRGGHISRSMELIRKRVTVLQKLNRQSIEITVGTCSDDKLYPGTKVEMRFSGQVIS